MSAGRALKHVVGAPDRLLPDAAIRQRIEFLRIVLIVGIVVLHIPPSWPLDALPPEARQWPGVIKLFCDYGPLRAGVPALSMISGYLLFLRPCSSYPLLVRRKVGTLLMPFLAWNGVVVALHLVRGQNDLAVLSGGAGDLGGWLLALSAFLDAPPNYPTYFLVDLFLLALLSPLLGVLLSRAPVPVLAVALLLLVVGYEPLPTVRPDVALPFMVGAAAALHRVDPRVLDPYVWPLIAGFLLISVVFVAGLAVDSPLPLSLGLVRTIGAPAVWALASLLAPTACGRRVAGWSGYAFIIFCAHSPALHLLAGIWPERLGYWVFYVSAAPIVIGAVLIAGAMLRRWAHGVLTLLTGTRAAGRSMRDGNG
jgi:succinoglycan biosynthesis protein ExoH